VTNQTNHLDQLGRIIKSGPEKGEDKQRSKALVESYEVQKRTLSMQQGRLQKAKQEMNEAEGNLKVLYNKLLADFEDWWNNNDALNS
jgi:flagellar motility protein MotE (MotC chaperone)